MGPASQLLHKSNLSLCAFHLGFGLETETAQIDDATEEAILFVNDKAGIISTALNHKTLIDPADPEAAREFFKLFINRVEVFARDQETSQQRGIIHYDLPIRRAESEDVPGTETILLEKKRASVSTKTCGLDHCTGIG